LSDAQFITFSRGNYSTSRGKVITFEKDMHLLKFTKGFLAILDKYVKGNKLLPDALTKYRSLCSDILKMPGNELKNEDEMVGIGMPIRALWLAQFTGNFMSERFRDKSPFMKIELGIPLKELAEICIAYQEECGHLSETILIEQIGCQEIDRDMKTSAYFLLRRENADVVPLFSAGTSVDNLGLLLKMRVLRQELEFLGDEDIVELEE
jgi:hypothetical protein